MLDSFIDHEQPQPLDPDHPRRCQAGANPVWTPFGKSGPGRTRVKVPSLKYLNDPHVAAWNSGSVGRIEPLCTAPSGAASNVARRVIATSAHPLVDSPLSRSWTDKSDLRNPQAIVQPRLYDSLMVTQIMTVLSPAAGSDTPLGTLQVVTTDNGLTILLVVTIFVSLGAFF